MRSIRQGTVHVVVFSTCIMPAGESFYWRTGSQDFHWQYRIEVDSKLRCIKCDIGSGCHRASF